MFIGDRFNNRFVVVDGQLPSGLTFYGERGRDTLELTGNGLFDFTGVTLDQVERIELTGTGVNYVTFETVEQARKLEVAAGAYDYVTINEVRGFGPQQQNLSPALYDLLSAGVEQVRFTGTKWDGTAIRANDGLYQVHMSDTTIGGAGSAWTTATWTYRATDLISRVDVLDDGPVRTIIYDEHKIISSVTVDGVDGSSDDTKPWESMTIDYFEGYVIERTTLYDPSMFNIATKITYSFDEYDGFSEKETKTTYRADGSVHVQGYAFGNILYGTNYNDVMVGGHDLDSFTGGTGDDTMTGGSYFDSYGFGGGNDVVTDFQLGDRIYIAGVREWEDLGLQNITQDGDDVLIIVPDEGSIRLLDYVVEDLRRSLFYPTSDD